MICSSVQNLDQLAKELPVYQHDSTRPGQMQQPIRDQLNVRTHGSSDSKIEGRLDANFIREFADKLKPSLPVRDLPAN
jgi:hypothetical protein